MSINNSVLTFDFERNGPDELWLRLHGLGHLAVELVRRLRGALERAGVAVLEVLQLDSERVSSPPLLDPAVVAVGQEPVEVVARGGVGGVSGAAHQAQVGSLLGQDEVEDGAGRRRDGGAGQGDGQAGGGRRRRRVVASDQWQQGQQDGNGMQQQHCWRRMQILLFMVVNVNVNLGELSLLLLHVHVSSGL